MSVTLKRVTVAVFLVYLALTCYTAYVLLSKSYTKSKEQRQHKLSRFSGEDSSDWNPWGEELMRSNASRQARTVEIWSKAAIGLYLWEHILNGRLEPKGGGAWSYGFRKIADIKFKFRTGPGIVPSTVPQDATHVVLVLNGRAPEKVAAARTWLDALPGFRKLRGVAVVLLGSEACSGNSWLLPYLRSRGGPVAAAFIVYDTALVDDAEVFQWPLGVATYRGFPKAAPKDLDLDSPRPYPCNFVGTVYPKSSREELLRLLGDRGAPCYMRARSEWRPLETKDSLESYLLALKLSDVTLNPAGMNPECYRIYEALEFGSVPVLEDRTVSPGCARAADGGSFRLLKAQGAPVLYVRNWTSELMPLLEREVAMAPAERADRRRRLVAWYGSFKRAMRDRLLRVLAEKFFGDDTT
ncbi:ribitol-5-phosphate xylosyltransferase 1 [Ixodes scapularis]|uniref:ribitol-5-phosphate xylosyltransferase 1 n=1 Tax=Ixodes scapularis TaxID=6945 RepID=UPI001A9D5E7F|nr:ribitol-5-phosphate xylosyltransferase 1 [Ixodes scapularis]